MPDALGLSAARGRLGRHRRHVRRRAPRPPRHSARVSRARARRAASPALLVTFRPHPLEVVNRSAAPMLLTPDDEQLEALADSGPLLVAVLPFTPALAAIQRRGVRRARAARALPHARARDRPRPRPRPRDGRATRDAARDSANGAASTSRSCRRRSTRRRSDLVERDPDVDRARRSRARARRSGPPYAFRGRVVPGDSAGARSAFRRSTSSFRRRENFFRRTGYTRSARTRRAALRRNDEPRAASDVRRVRPYARGAPVRRGGDWYGEAVSVELIRRLRDTTRFDERRRARRAARRDAAATPGLR